MHADVAAGAGPVLDDELLVEMLRQILAEQARDDVVGTAGREADDEVDRLGRIIERGRARPRARARQGKAQTDEQDRAVLRLPPVRRAPIASSRSDRARRHTIGLKTRARKRCLEGILPQLAVITGPTR